LTDFITYGEVLGLTSALMVAISGLLIRTQSYKVSPVVMNTVRCLVATAFFWILLPFDRPLTDFLVVPAKEWALLLGAVMIGPVTGETSYLRAIREIGLSRTMAISGTYPLATLLFDHLLLGTPFQPSFLFGSVLVVLGVIALATRSSQPESGPEGSLVVGVSLSLLAATLWGLSTVLLKPALANLTVIQANSIRMPQVALVLFLVYRGTGHRMNLPGLETRSLMIVAVTGVLSMGLGSYLFLSALEEIGPAKTATLTSMSPVFGLLLAILLLKEKVTLRIALGVILCVTGVWFVL
jgi:drug/metabolite transporter (DMT)-like permease